MTLSFTTPEPPPRVKTKIDLDGEELWAIQPKGGQMLNLQLREMAGAGEAVIINEFLDLCMEPESAARIRDRLADPDDWFDVDTLTQIVDGLQTVWSGRPPTKSAASSKRRASTGRTSTASTRRVASTPETSTRLASAT